MLGGFLFEMSARFFAYGQHDCGLFVASWIERVTERDPAAAWRGAYHDENGLIALCPGGWPSHFDKMISGAGMVRADEVKLGDVALILGADRRPHAVVRTAASFVTASQPVGIGAFREGYRVIRAWSFP